MSEWISVKDRLPEEFDDVLIVTVSGRISIAYLHSYNKENIIDYKNWAITDSEEGNTIPFVRVTHWMPLPKSPNLE